MGIFNSGSPGISVALDVPWPANVSSGPGVTIDKTNAQWTVGLDFPPLVDGGSPSTPSDIYLAGYSVSLVQYQKLRLDNIIASATGVDQRTPRGDADYSILVSDRYVGLTAALTAIRTWTLPAANTVPGGRLVTIQDEVGGISAASHLLFAPTGADTINGLAGYRLMAKFGGLAFRSDGTSKWSVAYSWEVSAVADTAYTVRQGDIIVAYTSISAARIVTLPAATAYPAGQRLTIIDYSGSCSGSNTISIARVGSDTINGATSQVINQAYGSFALVSDGTSKWTIVDSSAVITPINGVSIGATTPSTGSFTTLASTGGTLNGTIGGTTPAAGAFTTITTTTPRLIRGFDTATNLQINATVGSNILTVALKGEDGNDPSATNPIYLPVRDITVTNGDLSWLAITAATSIVTAVGASFGVPNTQPFRLWLVGFNDGGTFRLGLINCLLTGGLFALRARMQDVTTSALIDASSTAAGTFYTAGSAVTGKCYTILGYLEWSGGLTTSGTFASGPTKIQLFGPGVPTPGEPTGNTVFTASTGSSTTSASFVDVTGATVTIVPTSAANLTRFSFTFSMLAAKAGGATNSTMNVQALRAAVVLSTIACGTGTAAGLNADSSGGGAICGIDRPGSVSSLVYKLQQVQTAGSAGSVTTNSINIIVEELMG